MENKQEDPQTVERLERYLKDVELIRNTLESEEDLLLIKPWALVSWGVFVLVGTALSYFLWKKGFSQHQLYLTVWIPIIVIGGLFEIIAWLQQTKAEAIPLFTRRIVRTMISAFTMILSLMMYLWFFLDHALPLAGPILLGIGVTLIVYCQFTFHDAYPESFIVFGSGLIFTFGGFRGLWSVLFAGILPGILMVEVGIRYIIKGRKGDE